MRCSHSEQYQNPDAMFNHLFVTSSLCDVRTVEMITKNKSAQSTAHNQYTNLHLMKMNPRIPPRSQQGSPKYEWAERAFIEHWSEVRKTLPDMKNTEYYPNRENMKHMIKEHASV